MDQNKDKINLLKKLKELSERGVGGEKIEATKLLDKLLKKYNLSETDLGSEEIKEIKLTFKGAEEENLLLQVCYKVFGTTESVTNKVFYYRYGKGSRNTKIIECTSSEAAQIVLLYDFYRELWKKEREKLFSAFIQKNEIFGKSESNSSDLSDEEICELLKLMSIFKKAEIPSLRLNAPDPDSNQIGEEVIL